MADAWEILYGLNPNDPLDTISDKDYDGFVALQEFIEGTIPSPETWMSWDFDGDGVADAVTDCLLLLRYSFGLRDEVLTDGVISPFSSITTAEVQAKVAASTTTLFADIDDSGDVDALTDGLLLLRYLFGLRGDQLLNSALSNDANRDNAEDIEGYIQSLMPRS